MKITSLKRQRSERRSRLSSLPHRAVRPGPERRSDRTAPRAQRTGLQPLHTVVPTGSTSRERTLESGAAPNRVKEET
jgi:hypothetical protein